MAVNQRGEVIQELRQSIAEKCEIIAQVSRFLATREGRIFARLPILALIVSSPGGKIEWASDMWEPVTGWTCDELKASLWRHYVHPEDMEGSEITFSQQMAGTPVVNFVNRWRTKSGQYLRFSWSATDAIDGMIYAVVRTYLEGEPKR